MALRRIAAAILLLAITAAVAEEPTPSFEVAWSSFLRERPSHRARVLEEVGRGSPYRLLACAGGWCQVALGATTGYLPQSALTAPPALRPGAGSDALPVDCVGFLRRDRTPEMLCRSAGPSR